ncbi:MAG TPA: VOC family protein [Candidatus Dormibacteraeota bacterium]
MIRVVVRDLEVAARAHAAVYGIERWRLDGGSATGANRHGVAVQLVAPDGPFAAFLAERGEGIHSVALDGGPDPPVALGGWTVERSGGEPGPGGGEWAFAPDDPLPAEIERVWHVGVPVPDLDAAVAEYAARLGAPAWSEVELRPEGSTLDGEPVAFALRLARAAVAGLEIELIQPASGPTHYGRGPFDGVHHVLALPALSDETWPGVRDWMAARGAPVAMSGSVRAGAAEFFYLDTRRMLGGYLLEAIVRRN